MATADVVAPTPNLFDARRRAQVLREVDGGTFDLVIVGGGVNGSGVAFDASLRALKVLVLEHRDLAFGTSSRSSKLVHGGLRYLEQYQFRLVFEGTNERAVLRKIAPHLVRPLMFALPVYKGDRFPLWMVDIGLWMYDSLALFKAERFHQTMRSAARMLEREPLLDPEGLTGGIIYYDCMTDDARMTLENAMGAAELGSPIITRARVTGVEDVRAEDRPCTVSFTDLTTPAARTRPQPRRRQLHRRVDRLDPPPGRGRRRRPQADQRRATGGQAGAAGRAPRQHPAHPAVPSSTLLEKHLGHSRGQAAEN